MCISYLVLHNKFPKSQQFKAASVCYLTQSLRVRNPGPAPLKEGKEGEGEGRRGTKMETTLSFMT